MKTLLELGGREYVLPQKDAIAVMNAMGKAIRVEVDWREAHTKRPGDHRRHYVIQEHQDLIEIRQVQDDQIHIPADLAKPAPARPANAMLGYSGRVGAQ